MFIFDNDIMLFQFLVQFVTHDDGVRSHLTPLLHTALLRRVSMRTSGVPISFTANLRISLMARGALFLKLLQETHRITRVYF